MLKRLMAVTLLAVMTGCGGVSTESSSTPTLDTSSEAAFVRSLEAMEKSLEGDEVKLERFFDYIAHLEETRGGASHETLKDLHGSTVDDIIAKVDEEAKKME